MPEVQLQKTQAINSIFIIVFFYLVHAYSRNFRGGIPAKIFR